MRPRPLTARDLDVLAALADAHRAGIEWARPKDVGARDGSHHYHTLTKLAARGLVQGKRASVFRTSRDTRQLYRMSAAGLERLALHSAAQKIEGESK